MIPFPSPLPFEVDRALAALGWYALLAALVVAAVFAMLAFTRERPKLIWWSAAAVGVAFIPAAALPGQPALAASVLIALLGGGIAVIGGSSAAVLALDTAMGGAVEPGLHGGIMVPPKGARGEGLLAERTEVLRGGITIGVLERIGAAGTIIAGFPEGLAVVVAIKGIGRFSELESGEARERFIIGTLASLVWACACALVVHLVIR